LKSLNLRILILTFVFPFALVFAGCASSGAIQDGSQGGQYGKETSHLTGSQYQSDKGILWKVEKPGVSASYVFGTIHSEDKRVTDLSDEINAALNAANTFVMEVILDEKTSKMMLRGMYFSDGRTLKSVTSAQTYRQSVAAMAKKDMPEDLVDMMKPWAVFTVLNMPEQKTGMFLDVMLYELSLKSGKKIVGLESMQEQLAVFDDMKIETQVSLLESTLESGEDLNKILDETMEIYLTHDLQQIMDLNDRYVALLDKDIADEFNQRLLFDRNKRMTERMIPLIETGNAFIAIGALHLPGKSGVLNLLRNKGYALSAAY